MINSFKQFLKRVYFRPLLVLFILFALCDALYISLHNASIPPEETVIVTGKIAEKSYDDSGNIKSITVGNVLCYVNSAGFTSLPPIGSSVKVTGELRKFKTAMNMGQFDQLNYYRARNINYYLTVQDITVVSYRNSVKERFNNLLYYISDKLASSLNFEAGTISTLLLGDKRKLPEERKLIYQMAGVSHFLVISGLHISAIGGFIYSLVRRILGKRIPACILSIIVLSAYGVLVGFGFSVIRALIMYSVRLFSYVFKRTYDQLSALSLSGIVTLSIFPYALTDMSFIYSYSTVLIISCFFIYADTKKKPTVMSRLLMLAKFPFTLAIFIMPVTLYFSGTYSLLTIIFNLLLVPFSAPILILSGLTLISCLIGFIPLAHIFDYLLHLILMFLDFLFNPSARATLCSINGQPPIHVIILYYVLLIAVLILFKYENINNVSYKTVVILSIAIMCFETIIPTAKISMLYAGQGECLVIKTGPRSAILSDCGSTSDTELARYTAIPYLKAAGITKIDAILISHPDKDHTVGIPYLITESEANGITLKEIIYPEYYEDNATIREIIDLSSSRNIKTTGISKGYTASFNNLTITCLNPVTNSIRNDTNLDSLVFIAAYKNCSILLTGDIASEIEKELIANPLTADILKIAHHGSSTATASDFLENVNPAVAIISAGINNRYNHPHEETLARLNSLGIPTYVTRDSGEIDIIPNNNRMIIKTYIR